MTEAASSKRLLVARGADVAAVDIDGDTALDDAIGQSNGKWDT